MIGVGLDDSWQIVVIATSDDVGLLDATLSDVLARSYGKAIEVLAIDAAPIREYLQDKEHAVSYLLPRDIHQSGFWAAILSVYKFSQHRTVFVRAGALVPEHWDARLVAAGHRASEAIAVSPLCVKHPVLCAFYDPDHVPGLSVDEVDQWLNDYVDGREFSVPVLLESCLLLQGEQWRAYGPFEDDHELLQHIRLQGELIVATDQLYIDDSRVSYSTDIEFLPRAYLNAYSGRHPLTDTRHALLELSARGEKPPLLRACLPVQLHVGHSWGGGLGRWIEDYLAADKSHNHLVLRSVGDLSAFGQTIALYHSAAMGVPLRSWVLSEPIMSTALSHFEYIGLLAEIVDQFSVESLMISSLIGHSLDLLRTELKTTYVFHDFFPFCPALYATYGSPCQVCTATELRQCGRKNPLHSFFKLESDAHWLSVREAFVKLLADDKICAIAPSLSVAQRYRQLVPEMSNKNFNVIEHGLEPDFADALAVGKPRRLAGSTERLKIVIPGRLSEEKGGELLARIVDELTEYADIWLLGAGDSGARFADLEHITVVAQYKKEELGEYLRQVDADLALLISVVPETFSYTLSEMWAAGLPVLATRLGAFADRVAEGKNGWLVDIDGQAILQKIKEIASNADMCGSVRAQLASQSVRTSTQMVSDYNALESVAAQVPPARYYLPRRSYQNPYKTVVQDVEKTTALHVDHQVKYREVLVEFLTYTSRRLEQSPRLPRFIGYPLNRILKFQIRLLTRRNKL